MTRRSLAAVLTVALATSAFAVPSQAQTVSPIVINEVESNGDPVGDWVELANTNHNETLDISGWSVVDNDDKHQRIVIPEGTTIESGGYFSLYTEGNALPGGGFGLGGKDSVRLFNKDGEMVEQTTWDGHAETTWGRLPDMTGDFGVTREATRSAKNVGGNTPDPVVHQPWPFDPQEIQNVDLGPEFAVEDMSGVDFDANGRAWIVNNDQGTLFALDYKENKYSVAGTWNLKYADGSGLPDAEGVTVTKDGLYVATERDNANKNTSRPSVLRFNIPTQTGGDLSATNEWNLGQFLPATLGANAGLEAISAVPGGFAAGVEGTGEVLFVDLAGAEPTLVQRYQSPFKGVMALDYRENQLRVMCDEACEGASILLERGTEWAPVSEVQARPAAMGNFANEGFASYSDGCSTRFLWADDGVSNGTSMRAAMTGTPCVDEDESSSLGSLDGSTFKPFFEFIFGVLSTVGGTEFFEWIKSLLK